MLQSEIDEISIAFHESWKEYFGTTHYLVPLMKDDIQFDDVYHESKKLKYDFKNKIAFCATQKELPNADTLQPYGRDDYKLYELTIVTKELLDSKVYFIDPDFLIIYDEKRGDKIYRRYFKIYDDYKKVEFGDSKIFTKISVIEQLQKNKYVTEGTKDNG